MDKFKMGDAEMALFKELIDICGSDVEKLASARGEKLDLRAAVSPEDTPGLLKVASLLSMSLDKMMEDPNFMAGVNHELRLHRDEWMPVCEELLNDDE